MEENQVIVLLVLTGAMIMLILALVVIFFVTQHRKKYLIQENELLRIKSEKEQELLKAIITIQEQERTRIGANLHDSIGVDLAVVKLNLTKHIALNGKNIDLDYFKSEMENFEKAMQNIRDICKDLYPKTLFHVGFISSLAYVVSRLNVAQATKATFYTNMTEEDLLFDSAVKLDLYRICQEVLNNLIKYSEFSVLDFEMLPGHEDGLQIRFKHNGVVFLNEDVEKMILQNNGMGLNSIKNRINLIKGKINYLRQEDVSLIEIFVPFNAD